MWKRALPICTIALLGLLLPSLASANWTHKGVGELAEDASVTLSGEVTLTTSAGNVTCPTSIGATLTKKSTAGDINTYTVSEPSKCDLTGSLGSTCGTHGLTKVEKTGTWVLTAESTDIKLSSIDLHFKFAGCATPSLRLKGTATMSVSNASAISSTTLSGSQTLYNALDEEIGSGSLGGTLSVSPAATYGIVKGHFTYETKSITGEKDAELTGILGFRNFLGGYECNTHANVKVNTEDAKITSFVTTTNECTGEGAWEECELESDTTTVDGKSLSSENPITATIDANTNLTLDGNITIHTEFKSNSNCPVEEATMTFPHIVGKTQLSGGYISGFQLDSTTEGTTHVFGLEVPTETYGSAAVTPNNKFSISTVGT